MGMGRGEKRNRERKEGECGAAVRAQGRKVRRGRRGRIIMVHISAGGRLPPARQTAARQSKTLAPQAQGRWSRAIKVSFQTHINFMVTAAVFGCSVSSPFP